MSSNILQCLQKTFGGIPGIVLEHMKYFTYDKNEEKFLCKLCQKRINKNSPRDLEAHLNSGSHKEKSVPLEETIQGLTRILGKIPQIVWNNIRVLEEVREGFDCVICMPNPSLIRVSKDPKISVNNFSYHLTSIGHEGKLETYKDQIKELTDVYGEIPEVVNNNKEFLQLDKSGKNYACTLCKVLLKVHRDDIEQTENIFSQHFYSCKHLNNVKRSKVLSRIPELQHSSSTVHTYLTRNIDYISDNAGNLFCSLCNVNIKRNSSDLYETEENLKYHILSKCHEEKVFSRQNEYDERLENLIKVTGVFGDDILKNLRYLELCANSSIICSICKKEFNSESEEFIEDVVHHLESDFHERHVSEENCRNKNLKKSLACIFGEMPRYIRKNRAYIEFFHDDIFRCSLCGKDIPSMNLGSHLKSKRHREKAEEEGDGEEMDEDEGETDEDEGETDEDEGETDEGETDEGEADEYEGETDEDEGETDGDEGETDDYEGETDGDEGEMDEDESEIGSNYVSSNEGLEKLLGQNYENTIPECIRNNWSNIKYERNKGNFYCSLCNEAILLVGGTKKEELTLRNLKSHLYSAGHNTKLKEKASLRTRTCEKLKSIYGGVPKCILNNVQYLRDENEDSFYCDLCGVEIQVVSSVDATTQNFLRHLRGHRHKNKVEYIETSIDDAFKFLDDKFGVPEFLMKDIDFWESCDNPDLFCSLCQSVLSVDLDDLKETRTLLECHVNSKQHKDNLNRL